MPRIQLYRHITTFVGSISNLTLSRVTQESREESANKIVKLEAQVETLESRLQQLRFERQLEDDTRVNSVLNSFEARTNQLELKLETEKLDKHKLQVIPRCQAR